MAERMPEHGYEYNEFAWIDNDRNSSIIAFLFLLLLDAAIIGLFMFITWLAYNTS